MYLQDIKLVDLKASKWDKAKSEPKKGTYVFSDKKYVDSKHPDASMRPQWKFLWNRYSPVDNYRDVRDWEIKWGFSFLTTDDPYWPEGVPPDAEGKYVFGDLVMMKCPILNWIRKRKREIEASERAPEASKRAFMQEAKNHGIDVTEEVLEEMRKK